MTMMYQKDTARRFNIELTDHECGAFETYANALIKANTEINLTSITEPENIKNKHVLDSLALIPHIPKDARTCIDVGSGAGFPGMALAIVKPDLRVTLLEATKKKASFLEDVAETLDLKNVSVVAERAEVAGTDILYREQFDVAVARAVASLPTLVEYLLPFVKVGGIILAPKIAYEEELESAQSAITVLGGMVSRIEVVAVADVPTKYIVVIEKISPTPETYPRKPGRPAKRPL
jgi:16S rRNA (guanine527-N7)-methyltransferase